MTDALVLYSHPMSRGRIVRWILEELGVPYRAEILQYGESMKAPEYLRINPMGKVPALVHEGTVVTECAAICAYLADTFPEAGLAPAMRERGAYYRWLFFAAGPLEAAMADRTLGVEPDSRQQMMVGYGSLGQVLETLEGALPAQGYIAGDRFTAADVYLGSHIGWWLEFGHLESRPRFADYWARVSDREGYRRARALDDALMPSAP